MGLFFETESEMQKAVKDILSAGGTIIYSGPSFAGNFHIKFK